MPKTKCKQLLADQIRDNLSDYYNGMRKSTSVPKKRQYKSREQAIAVAYSQVNKSHPKCRQHIRSRSHKSHRRKSRGRRSRRRKSRGRRSRRRKSRGKRSRRRKSRRSSSRRKSRGYKWISQTEYDKAKARYTTDFNDCTKALLPGQCNWWRGTGSGRPYDDDLRKNAYCKDSMFPPLCRSMASNENIKMKPSNQVIVDGIIASLSKHAPTVSWKNARAEIANDVKQLNNKQDVNNYVKKKLEPVLKSLKNKQPGVIQE